MNSTTIWGAPGTGKTHNLIQKYLDLSGKHSTKMLITFRKSTADSIREQLNTVSDQEVTKSEVNTTHGACYQLLGGKEYAKLIEAKDFKQFYKDTGFSLQPYNIEHWDVSNGSKSILEAYNWALNTLTPIEEIYKYPQWGSLGVPVPKAVELLNEFEIWREYNGKLLFSDMLYNVYKTQMSPNVDYLLVDEFQDFTKLQYEIFKVWAADAEEVVIAGDPLQSIYGFWGASPDYFKDTAFKEIVLEQSYRVPKKVWALALQIIKMYGEKAPGIAPKNIDGSIRTINSGQYLQDPTAWEHLTKRIFHLIRSNYQAHAVAGEMARAGILWKGLDGWTPELIELHNTFTFYRENRVLRDADIQILMQHYPKRMFTCIGNEGSLSAQNLDMFGVGEETIYSVLESDTPGSFISKGLKAEKINNALERHPYELDHNSINTYLLTIHGAKGLEADRVFLHTGVTKNIQRTMFINPTEEARVWYVGVTRTSDELIIVRDKGINYPIPLVGVV
ncbi:UvrD-helicase domain-containing protein [Methanosalsum natronophilum]|uniref:UvrD-helicase domain-containing protein n=1 Tax=Methanosalsum natronophilum TaxID=768733 RepID=UPI002167A977|nr:ATP-dependent helicase [Methanosalsum natronophilum]MCS3924906.1 DNA helicase-2/ATP-dependent DNA helicase PcrA [Methanosalsum natronophilum]